MQIADTKKPSRPGGLFGFFIQKARNTLRVQTNPVVHGRDISATGAACLVIYLFETCYNIQNETDYS
jgi:hypothetical protein